MKKNEKKKIHTHDDDGNEVTREKQAQWKERKTQTE